MSRAKLDRIDRKILRDLQEDGRITNVDLAKRVGISAPPCLRRVRALEDAGFIQSYHARVNAHALGYGVTVFASVKLDTQDQANLENFEKKMNDLSLVRECYLLAGDYDFMLKIVAKDWDSYQEFHSKVLTKAIGVTSVRSTLSLRSTKFEPGVPIEE